jgi:hypothetical protein
VCEIFGVDNQARFVGFLNDAFSCEIPACDRSACFCIHPVRWGLNGIVGLHQDIRDVPPTVKLSHPVEAGIYDSGKASALVFKQVGKRLKFQILLGISDIVRMDPWGFNPM